MKKLLLLFILFVFFLTPNYSQILDAVTNQDKEPGKIITKDKGFNFKSFPTKSFYKSKADWQHIIDSTWGQGVPTATKLQVFDDFWNLVDQSWGGFPNLEVNWDSLKNVYRPLVEAGVSRGRFAGILSRLTRALQEWHTGLLDRGIDSTLGLYTSYWKADEYPNYPSFYYSPGIPVININSLLWRTNFGAGLTLLPDNRIMVYNVMPNHPLNLQPGDIILGYDGIPWKQLLDDLLRAELPILTAEEYGTKLGASTAAVNHAAMISVGMNWGLFDTIDVVKYSTNDTLHYPTSLLAAIKPPYLIATEQLPVKGVPFPDIQGNKLVSWGIVEGTNIGYIFAWDWYGASGQPSTKALFGQAVDDLMHINHVSGLILDFRTNYGGMPDYANDGFKYLFNIDPTYHYSSAKRVNGNDHYAFTIYPDPQLGEQFTPTPEVFDHPIAILLGPNCGSSGDYNAFRLRFHPMARSFGKPTNGAYSAYPFNGSGGNGPYLWRVDGGCLYSNVNDEGYLIHKGCPVDEEVWLTREVAAKGEDDVVKRALEWINNSVYGHDLTKNSSFRQPGMDTLKISVIIENPNSHQVFSKIYIRNLQGNFTDSLALHKVVSSGKSETWNGNYRVPDLKDFFTLSLSTTDVSDSKTFTIENISQFTTEGPVVIDHIDISFSSSLKVYNIKPHIHNQMITATITKASVKLICNDPWIKSISPEVITLADIAPGSIVKPSTNFSVKYIDSIFPGYFNFKFEVLSDGRTYWEDSMQVLTGVEEDGAMPLTFKLEQNYPNPFNPSTVISYQLPVLSKVQLKVFDILGREVATLVNEEKLAGNYEIEFDGSKLASGIYFYQLQAGDFIQSKKMVLMK